MRSSLTLIWTVTAATTLLQAGNGLLQALLPLRMQAEGLSIPEIGLVAAAYGLGFSTGCVMAPAFIRHVGYIRAFASLAALASVIVLLQTQAHATWVWVGMRGLTGVTLACIFTVTDGWISARTTQGNRGRILSFYTVCTKVTLMLAPLGVSLGEITRDGLFMAVSAIMCLSLLPIAATDTEEPPAPQGVRIQIRSLFAVAPAAVVATFVIGMVNGPVVAITPVFGTSIGLTLDEAAALLFGLQAGSLVLQWPLGWLSDRFDRRFVIAGMAAGTCLMSLLILATSASMPATAVIVSFGLWGGLSLCVYSVCVAHACDRVEPQAIIATVGSLLFAWAAGVTIGPLIAAMAMERLGPGGLFIYSAVLMLGLAGFISIRIVLEGRSSGRRPSRTIAPARSISAGPGSEDDTDREKWLSS